MLLVRIEYVGHEVGARVVSRRAIDDVPAAEIRVYYQAREAAQVDTQTKSSTRSSFCHEAPNRRSTKSARASSLLRDRASAEAEQLLRRWLL